MDRLEKWIAEIGLEKYLDVLREAEIDFDILGDLTDADLQSIGVPLGARKRLVKAASMMSATTDEPLPPPQSIPSIEPERRQLTVMFCDMLGSTELSERFDPEDLSTILRTYQQRCREVIEHHEGTIARYLGDGIMVYFGYPIARENDAERAIRAALEIVQVTSQTEVLGHVPTTRVGIATGPVVVGEVIGKGLAQEQAVVGATPNLAARLQSLVTTSGVVIANHTRRLAGEMFEYDDFGDRQIKGLEEPVQVWLATRERLIESRFEAIRGPGKLLELVGRDEELERLCRRWERACNGRGQVATLVGEAGIGKSRLVQALRSHVTHDALTEVRLFCAPGYQNTTLAPFIGLIHRSAGIEVADTDEVKFAKLEEFVARNPNALPEWAPLYAGLLSIDRSAIQARYGQSDTPPSQERSEALSALQLHLQSIAIRRPLLIVFEDLHWVDPTSQELLEQLVLGIENLPIMLLATGRPELNVPWPDMPYSSTFILNRLDQETTRRLIAAASGRQDFPEVLINRIAEKADGIPLFAEELTHTVVQSDRLTEALQATTNSIMELSVPSTLQDSLMARLDRMSQVKGIIQTAAGIGRTFTWELLRAVGTYSEAELNIALKKLADAGIVRGHGIPPNATYTFKHALLQDAAFDSMLKSRRQELHGHIARVLEEHYPQQVEAEPEVLASHWAGAGKYEQAAAYSSRAGERNVERSSYPEAVNHFSMALEYLLKLEPSNRRTETEIELRSFLGSSLMATRGYTVPEVGENYQRAIKLCDEVRNTPHRFSILYGLWLYHLVCSEKAETQALTQQIIDLAKLPGNEDRQIASHFVSAITSSYAGDFVTARDQFDKLLKLYDPKDHLNQMLTYSDDLGLFSYVQMEWIDVLSGRTDQALEKEQRVMSLAEEVSDAMSLTRSHIFAMMRRHDIREVDDCHEMAERAIALSKKHGFDMWHAIARFGLGWSLAMRGEPAKGIEEIQTALEFFQVYGQKLPLTYWASYLVEVYLSIGEIHLGLDVVEDALEMAANNVDNLYEPELLRLKGELLLLRDDRSDAEQCFRNAINVAVSFGAELLALRASVSLANILVVDDGVDKKSEARQLLQMRCDAVTEGRDIKDVLTAKALLESLA